MLIIGFGKLNNKWSQINIWKKTLFTIALIAVIMAILLTFIGQHFIVDKHNTIELKKNLSQANYTLDDNLEHLEIASRSLAFNLQHHQSRDIAKLLISELKSFKNQKPDIILLVDKDGRLIWSKNTKETGLSLKELSVVNKGFRGKEILGYEVIPERILKAEGILDKAKVKVKPDKGYNYRSGDSINMGLFQIVGIPLFDDKNNNTAILVTGTLINNDNKIIEEISLNADAPASIILDGVRITTSFKDNTKKYITGTLVAPEITNRTINQGKDYYGNLIINNKNTNVAYRPIRDLDNKIVAVFGITVNEQPILDSQHKYQFQLYILVGIVLILICYLLWWLYNSVVRGIWTLVKGVRQLAKGHYSIRIFSSEGSNWRIQHCKHSNNYAGTDEHPCVFDGKEVDFGLIKEMCPACNLNDAHMTNEVEYLANMFNYMALVLEERETRLKETNEELGLKNFELISQQEELQAQQEELEAQQEELIAQQNELMNLNEQLAATIDELDDIEDIIYSLALAIEAKDPYTRGHSERVAMYAAKLAAYIGFSDEEQQLLIRAGTVHDIGKIGISESLLQKPSSLTKEEFSRIKEHPIIGEKICHSLKSAADLLVIIRHHHEHYNGNGYPDGLRGTQIPLYARIMAIADAYDAMTSDRPYRKGMTSEEAIEVLKKEAGKMWDPELVYKFIEAIN